MKSKDTLILYEQMPFDPNATVAEVKEVHRMQTYEVTQMAGIHSAFSTNHMEKVCMMDEKHIYIWNIEEKRITTLYNHFIRGLYFFDEQYLYTLTTPYKGRNGGLRMYEAAGLLDGQEDSYLLSDATIGCVGHIDYNRAYTRLAY
jgi:hypothetical protein